VANAKSVKRARPIWNSDFYFTKRNRLFKVAAREAALQDSIDGLCENNLAQLGALKLSAALWMRLRVKFQMRFDVGFVLRFCAGLIAGLGGIRVAQF
jgi:hypothetical protein